MTKLLSNPTVRLAGRALLVAVITILTQLGNSDGSIAWKTILVAGGLAFAEVFTPLNQLVGPFKKTPKSP